jgi:hypothetical protein
MLKSIMLWVLWLLGISIMVIASAVLNARFGVIEKGMAFIFESVLNVVGVTMITFGIIFERIRRFVYEDERYKTFSDIVFNRSKQYRPTIWAQFVIPFNEERKIKAYRKRIIKQEHALDAKVSEEKILAWLKYTPKQQLEDTFDDPYFIKKQQFLIKNEKWIKEHINSLYVKYDEVNYGVIFGGYLDRTTSIDDNDFITKGKTLKIIRENMPRILLSSGVFVLLSSLVLQFELSATFYYLALVKIVVSFWSTYLAWIYTDNYNQEVTLKDIAFRAGVAEEYNTFICKQIEKRGDCNGQ